MPSRRPTLRLVGLLDRLGFDPAVVLDAAEPPDPEADEPSDVATALLHPGPE